VDTCGVGIVAAKEAGARWRTERRSDETIIEGDTLLYQPVEVRRIHIREAEAADGVETLLVSDHKDDVWPLVSHDKDILCFLLMNSLPDSDIVFADRIFRK
jgi:hypothetical protein